MICHTWTLYFFSLLNEWLEDINVFITIKLKSMIILIYYIYIVFKKIMYYYNFSISLSISKIEAFQTLESHSQFVSRIFISLNMCAYDIHVKHVYDLYALCAPFNTYSNLHFLNKCIAFRDEILNNFFCFLDLWMFFFLCASLKVKQCCWVFRLYKVIL